MNDIEEAFDIRSKPYDLTADRTWRDTVVQVCICGNQTFRIVATFTEEGEIGGYFTEATCYECDRWVKVPTPIDEVERTG